MLILWIHKRKADRNKESGKAKKQLFQNHDDDMKKFRASHANTGHTGTNDILATDNSSIVPVHKVKLSDNIQN
jgi:hypothetical protein